MAKCMNSPNFLWKIENFDSTEKLVSPSISLNGLKWQLILSRFMEGGSQKIELVLECLSPSKTSSTWHVQVKYVKPDGYSKEMKSGTFSLKNKEWCVWTELVSNCSYYKGESDDMTFLVIITPTGTVESIFENQGTVEDSNKSPCMKSLSGDFKKLFNNKEHSDFRIKCGESSFYVHKGILSARSDYFAALLRSNMGEANEGSVNIEHVHPDILEQILHYLYTGEIELSVENIQKVYSAADRFTVEPLKAKCFSLFIDSIITVPKEDSGNMTGETVTEQDEVVMTHEKILEQRLRAMFMTREWRLIRDEFPDKAQEMCRTYLLQNVTQ